MYHHPRQLDADEQLLKPWLSKTHAVSAAVAESYSFTVDIPAEALATSFKKRIYAFAVTVTDMPTMSVSVDLTRHLEFEVSSEELQHQEKLASGARELEFRQSGPTRLTIRFPGVQAGVGVFALCGVRKDETSTTVLGGTASEGCKFLPFHPPNIPNRQIIAPAGKEMAARCAKVSGLPCSLPTVRHMRYGSTVNLGLIHVLSSWACIAALLASRRNLWAILHQGLRA